MVAIYLRRQRSLRILLMTGGETWIFDQVVYFGGVQCLISLGPCVLQCVYIKIETDLAHTGLNSNHVSTTNRTGYKSELLHPVIS